MTEREMQARTKQFALRVMRLVDSLPAKRSADVVGRQLFRSASSVGANYRAACHAKSRPDFVSKLGIVEEEADESCYWMELLVEGELVTQSKMAALIKEGDEILRIVSASRITAKRNSHSTDRRSQIGNRKSHA